MTLLDKVKDVVSGVFGGEEGKQDEHPINTPEQQKLVDMVLQDFDVFKANRQKVEGIWRQEQRFYRGDHWAGLRPESVSRMRPNSVDNIAWSQIEGIVAKLGGWMPSPEFEPMEPNDDAKAQDLNAYMPHELRCINFKQKHIRALRRMVIHGPLVYMTIYDPTVEGGYGMNRYIGNNDIIPVDLGSFFPDPRIKDFINLQKGGAHIIKTTQPLEYFEERWQEQGKKVKEDNDSSSDEIFDKEEYSQTGFNADTVLGSGTTEAKCAGLIAYWYRGRPKMLTKEDKTLFKELADESLAEGKDPSTHLARSKGTMKGVHCIYVSTTGVFLEHVPYVYDHGYYPIVARTLFPDEGNPWGKGYMRDMMAPQIMLNKFAEIAVETMAKQGNGAIVYEEQAIAKPEVWRERRSLPGAMLPVTSMEGWRELQGVNVPQTIFNMMEYYKDMLQKIPGQFDSSNGAANPNITSGEQAKALISASSQRLALAAELVADALQEVFMQYIELMAQFYTVERIGRVTGKQSGQVSMSRDKLINQVSTEYETGNKVIDPSTEQEVDEKIPVQEEYVPRFDITVNISVDKPHDREYNIQMAFNLLKTIDPMTQMPMIDGKAVQYTIQNGRMEPFDIIASRMDQEQQKAAKLAELEQENAVLQEMVQQLQGKVETEQQNGIHATNETLKLLNEQDKREHEKVKDFHKMAIEEQKVAVLGSKMG